eukprot:TRINITY_DN17586_c0_g1_i1.p1 TRINITY_DN17586_c0_g1~~TRINITY_DN17586_c0_g1_i1.p1  ORF type:complete len:223 (-),score=61.25 TRINITY_DN17586_c0_g1_i1:87-722(-)
MTTGPHAVALEQALAKLKAECGDQTGSVVVEKLGVRVVQRADRGGLAFPVLVGAGEIKADVHDVLQPCSRFDLRCKWDTFYDSGHLLSDDGHVQVYYGKSKGSFTVWPRDFVMATTVQEDGEGGFWVVTTSVEDPAVPPVSSCVRGHIYYAGFHLTSAPGGPGCTAGTKITYSMQGDAAGWIPTAIVNLVNKYQPLGIIGIRKFLTGTSLP